MCDLILQYKSIINNHRMYAGCKHKLMKMGSIVMALNWMFWDFWREVTAQVIGGQLFSMLTVVYITWANISRVVRGNRWKRFNVHEGAVRSTSINSKTFETCHKIERQVLWRESSNILIWWYFLYLGNHFKNLLVVNDKTATLNNSINWQNFL